MNDDTWEAFDVESYEDARYVAYGEQYNNLISPEGEVIAGAEVVFPTFEEWIITHDDELTKMYPHRPLH